MVKLEMGSLEFKEKEYSQILTDMVIKFVYNGEMKDV